MSTLPQIVAWEVTRRCGLQCRHCRGAARDRDYAAEFSTDACFRTIDALVALARPMLILTGGEPLLREDIHQVAAHATARGCRVVLATCGHLLDRDTVAKLRDAGVQAVSVSLDAATAPAHDDFRGVAGAYARTLQGLACLRAAGMPFQINATVTTLNVHDLPRMLERAVDLGAAAMDFFFLVPTGRGAGIADLELAPEARDTALQWIADQERLAPLRIKTTCAPLYKQFRHPEVSGRPAAPFKGCMGGRGFVFISHTGVLQPCGFLDLSGGDLRAADFDFARLYNESAVFERMRARNPFAECPAREYARHGCF